MLPDSIGFDIAEMLKNAAQLSAATEALPPVSTVTQNEGPTDSASGVFRHELRWTAAQLGEEVLKIAQEIQSLEGAITSHQQAVTAHDDATEGDITQLIGFIDSAPVIPTQPSGSPNSTTPSNSPSPAGTGTVGIE